MEDELDDEALEKLREEAEPEAGEPVLKDEEEGVVGEFGCVDLGEDELR